MRYVAATLSILALAGCKWGTARTSLTTGIDQRASEVFSKKFEISVTKNGIPQHSAIDMHDYARASWLSSGDKPLDVLPANHPIEKEIQAMVHELHAGFVKANPAYAAIPEPQAVVIKDDNPNAFTIPAGVLVPVKVVSDKPPERPYTQKGWMGVADGFLVDAENTHGYMDMLERNSPPAWAKSRPDLLAAVMASVQKNMPECSLRMNTNVVVMSDECYQRFARVNGYDNGIVDVVGFVQSTAAAGLFVNTGLISRFERRHVMSIVAHEMGHYYRFHTGETLREMAGHNPRIKDHYFRIPQYTNRMSKPPKDHSPEILELFKTLENGQVGHIDYKDFSLKHPVGLIKSVFDIFYTFQWRGLRSSSPPEVASCLRLKESYKVLETQYGALPGEWHKAPRELLLRADVQTGGCLKELSARSMGEWAIWSTLNENEKSKFFEGIRSELSSTMNEWPPLVDSFRIDSAVGELIRIKEQFNQKARALGARAQQIGFGWYTDEQEADEIAVHLMALAGENPRSAADIFFRHLGLFDTGGTNTVMPSLSECRKGFLNNWQDWRFNSVPWVPFFGYTYQLHPSDCYRIFNVDKETEAFGYGSIPTSRDSAQWREIQILAKP